MGSILSLPLSAIATCSGSLCGSCFASMMCKMCCKNCSGSTNCASVMYYMIISLFVGCALITEYHGGDIVIGANIKSSLLDIYGSIKGKDINETEKTQETCRHKYDRGWVICCADKCSGTFSVYRFSIALFMFSLTMFILTFRKSNMSSRLHKGFWAVKILYIMLLLTSTLFIDNQALIIYRNIARYLAIPFLFLQITLLIDSAYKVNEECVKLDENENACIQWKYGLLITSILLYIGCIITFVMMFIHLGGNDHNMQNFIISFTICVTTIFSLISCSKMAPHGAIITSAFVTTYSTYLCYSALLSYSDSYNISKERNNTVDLVLGLLLTSISMASLAWGMTGSQDVLMGNTALLEEGNTDENNENNEKNSKPESWGYFHFMMSMCALYMCMLLTNWSSNISNESIDTREDELKNFWVKLLSQWLCMFLYTWSLAAPYLLQNYRDFGIDFAS